MALLVDISAAGFQADHHSEALHGNSFIVINMRQTKTGRGTARRVSARQQGGFQRTIRSNHPLTLKVQALKLP
jgi:hypothetical protein